MALSSLRNFLIPIVKVIESVKIKGVPICWLVVSACRCDGLHAGCCSCTFLCFMQMYTWNCNSWQIKQHNMNRRNIRWLMSLDCKEQKWKSFISKKKVMVYVGLLFPAFWPNPWFLAFCHFVSFILCLAQSIKFSCRNPLWAMLNSVRL